MFSSPYSAAFRFVLLHFAFDANAASLPDNVSRETTTNAKADLIGLGDTEGGRQNAKMP